MLFKDLFGNLSSIHGTDINTNINTNINTVFFWTGLRFGNTRLAVAAMEELMICEDTDIIAAVLQLAANTGKLVPGTSMASTIGRSLKESRHHDLLLQKYGTALLEGEGGEGPFQWVKSGKAAKHFDHSGRYVELRDGIDGRYKTAQARYLMALREGLKSILNDTNLTPMERTAAKGMFAGDVEEALREALQPNE